MRSVKPGEIVRGRVVLVTRDAVTVDIGYKSEGTIPITEFIGRDGEPTVSEGEEIDVYFDADEGETGGIVLSRAKAEQAKVWRDIEDAYERNGVIDGVITGKVKGGLKVDVGVPAFLPGSHAALRPARNLDRFISQRTQFAVLKYNRARGNVVVSRRAVMERERQQLKQETLKVLEEGVILEGIVKNITDYGAFVDLGGIDGLLHVTDMSWGRDRPRTGQVGEGEVWSQVRCRPRRVHRMRRSARLVERPERTRSGARARQGGETRRLRRVRRIEPGMRGSSRLRMAGPARRPPARSSTSATR